jgi:hypothetical protein
MYRKHHNGQISIEEFHVPFGGTLDPENRWVLFASLVPSDEIEEAGLLWVALRNNCLLETAELLVTA